VGGGQFCEEPRDLTACFVDFEGQNHCDEESVAIGLVLTSLGGSSGLRMLADSFAQTTIKVAPNAGVAVKAARAWTEGARAHRDQLLLSIGLRALSSYQSRLVGRLAASVDFAGTRVAECQAATSDVQRSRKPGADGTAKRASLACARAADQALDLHEASSLLAQSLRTARR
jgi:hypothetical protein